jgi:hypothetical protein
VKWFSPIHPAANGNKESQKSRWRLAQRIAPVTDVQACGLIGARGMIRARCPHPSPKVRENKPATSAITSLRDGDPTERRHGYQNDFFLLWTRRKNRTTVEVRIHTSGPSSRPPCLALHRSTPPVQLPRNHRKSISAYRCDELVIADSNVTSKRWITPVRSFPAPREGACGEQGALSAFS